MTSIISAFQVLTRSRYKLQPGKVLRAWDAP